MFSFILGLIEVEGEDIDDSVPKPKALNISSEKDVNSVGTKFELDCNCKSGTNFSSFTGDEGDLSDNAGSTVFIVEQFVTGEEALTFDKIVI